MVCSVDIQILTANESISNLAPDRRARAKKMPVECDSLGVHMDKPIDQAGMNGALPFIGIVQDPQMLRRISVDADDDCFRRRVRIPFS